VIAKAAVKGGQHMPFERSSKGLRSSTIMAATVTVFLLAAMLYAPAPAEAGPSDISVRGWVWDSAYREVEGASVVVNVIDGGSTVTTESTTTDGDGFYSVFLLAAEWNVGNTFQIVVTFDSKQDTNQTIATSTPSRSPSSGALPGWPLWLSPWAASEWPRSSSGEGSRRTILDRA
jgi:hypothetical protein